MVQFLYKDENLKYIDVVNRDLVHKIADLEAGNSTSGWEKESIFSATRQLLAPIFRE